MKRHFICFGMAIVLSVIPHLTILSQTIPSLFQFHSFTPISPVLITIEDDCYVIRWTLPHYNLSYAPIDGSTMDFATVSFSDEIEHNPCFHKDNLSGLPELPFISLNLHIPNGTEVHYEIDSIEYDTDIDISAPYVPHQVINENFSFNSDYYNSAPNDWDEFCQVSSEYEYMGARGVNVKIRPFCYYPRGWRLRPILRFKIRICLSGNETLTEMYENAINNAGYSNAINYFTTYFGAPQNQLALGANCNGNFLIITTSNFEDQAEIYRQHKENMGYHADLIIVDGDTCTNVGIRSILLERYANIETRPKYVLIIGYKRRSYENGIPFSGGSSVMGENTCIDTDIFYSCLNNTPNSESQALLPQIMVGRWMVSTRDELDFIMQKSINFEFETITRRMSLFSGLDPNRSNRFDDECRNMIETISPDSSSIELEYYNGLEGATRNNMIEEFSENDNFLFVYNGHGNAQMICEPYEAFASHFRYIDKLPYFGLGFACELAMTDSHIGFACQWLNNCPRTCAFYGATCPVLYAADLGVDILSGLAIPSNLTIGELVYRGFAMYSVDYVLSIADGMFYGGEIDPIWMNEPFILYGDPSLYLYGMSWPGHPAHHIARSNSYETGQKHMRRVYNSYGLLLKEESIECVSDEIDSEGFPFGIIFVVDYDETGNVLSSQKLIK